MAELLRNPLFAVWLSCAPLQHRVRVTVLLAAATEAFGFFRRDSLCVDEDMRVIFMLYLKRALR